jgi:hypothetical protein
MIRGIAVQTTGATSLQWKEWKDESLVERREAK